MKMTKKRKSLQDKLRRKFKWKTNTNYNRGTILNKPDALTHFYHDPKYTVDLRVNFDDYLIRREILYGDGRGVEIGLFKYYVNGDGTYTAGERLTAYISMEELELIYKIAKEKRYEVCRGIFEVERVKEEGLNG